MAVHSFPLFCIISNSLSLLLSSFRVCLLVVTCDLQMISSSGLWHNKGKRVDGGTWEGEVGGRGEQKLHYH
jgi:hypothetical protein